MIDIVGTFNKTGITRKKLLDLALQALNSYMEDFKHVAYDVCSIHIDNNNFIIGYYEYTADGYNCYPGETSPNERKHNPFRYTYSWLPIDGIIKDDFDHNYDEPKEAFEDIRNCYLLYKSKKCLVIYDDLGYLPIK